MSTDILIFLAVIVVLLIVLYFYLKKRKRDKILITYKEEFDKIIELDEKVNSSLKRTDKISKNEESRKLYETWVNDYQTLKIRFDELHNLIVELAETNTNTKHNDFMLCANVIEGKSFEFEDQYQHLFKKIHHYTEFEIENTRISLTLKSRIKELSNTFDTKLKFLEIYNISFNQEITDAQVKIQEFEALQKNGDYPEGRIVLKECNRIIERIDYTLKLLLNFQNYLLEIDNDITLITKIKKEINKIGFEINIQNFDKIISDFINSREKILIEVTKIDFEQELSNETLSELEESLSKLDTSITAFKEVVEDKFNYIKSIITLKNKNTELLEIIQELIAGALSEKESIVKLYELSDIRQLTQIDKEVELFNTFREDYDKLLIIINDAKEDYSTSKSRITQSNQYLIRLLKNLEKAILELRAIRSDEIYARESIPKYEMKLIEIDLYLKKYLHTKKMGHQLKSLFYDLDIKFNELKEHLNQEPLNIAKVRNLNESVQTLLDSIIHNEAEKNIKQRLGSELMIKHISRFNKNDEMNSSIKRLENLYLDHEYHILLRESYELLTQSSSKGDELYKYIVAQVNVEPFKELLKIDTPTQEVVNDNNTENTQSEGLSIL